MSKESGRHFLEKFILGDELVTGYISQVIRTLPHLMEEGPDGINRPIFTPEDVKKISDMLMVLRKPEIGRSLINTLSTMVKSSGPISTTYDIHNLDTENIEKVMKFCDMLGIRTSIRYMSQIDSVRLELVKEGDISYPFYPDWNHQPIITIVGSMRFYDEMLEVASKLTDLGNIVLLPFKSNIGTSDSYDMTCAVLMKERIMMSRSIYVMNKFGYIGENTQSNIELARQLGKCIYYHEPINVEIARKENKNETS